MISPAFMVTILFAIVAVSHADQNPSTHDSQVLSKRFFGSGYSSYSSQFAASSFFSGSYLGANSWISSSMSASASYASSSIFGYGICPGGFSPILYAKDSDKHSVSRRAISLDADQLIRRGSDESVSCVNEKGATHEFVKSDCFKAAAKLSQDKVSSASHGLCTLTLVTHDGRVSPKSIPASAFQSTVDGILKACSKRRNSARSNTPVGDKNDKDDVAMVLTKNEHPTNASA